MSHRCVWRDLKELIIIISNITKIMCYSPRWRRVKNDGIDWMEFILIIYLWLTFRTSSYHYYRVFRILQFFFYWFKVVKHSFVIVIFKVNHQYIDNYWEVYYTFLKSFSICVFVFISKICLARTYWLEVYTKVIQIFPPFFL